MTISFQDFVAKAQGVVDARGGLLAAIGDAAAKTAAEAQAQQLRQEADQLVTRSRDGLNAQVADLQQAAADLGSLDSPDAQASSRSSPAFACGWYWPPMPKGPSYEFGECSAQQSAGQASGAGQQVLPKPPRFGLLTGRWQILTRIRQWLDSAGVPAGTVAHVMVMVAADLAEGKPSGLIVKDVMLYLASLGIGLPQD